jgi:hypothetical protein
MRSVMVCFDGVLTETEKATEWSSIPANSPIRNRPTIESHSFLIFFSPSQDNMILELLAELHPGIATCLQGLMQ